MEDNAPIVLAGSALTALLHALGTGEGVYKLRVWGDGETVKFKVNEDCWSQPYSAGTALSRNASRSR